MAYANCVAYANCQIMYIFHMVEWKCCVLGSSIHGEFARQPSLAVQLAVVQCGHGGPGQWPPARPRRLLRDSRDDNRGECVHIQPQCSYLWLKGDIHLFVLRKRYFYVSTSVEGAVLVNDVEVDY